jgi:hypothetical protein
MKTTVEIPDDLLDEARAVACRERATLRSLIEEGLRWVVSRRKSPGERFVLKDAAVSGKGVRAGMTEGDWEPLRDEIYRGRGS